MKRKLKPPDDDNGFGEMGGYMAAKISKLEDQFRQQANKNVDLQKSNLFNGISIFVNGYTRPSPDELKRIMMENGGVYHTYQRSWTTFVIANNLPDVKIRALGKEKVIKPDWVVDCLRENRILDYSNYLIYTNQKSSQPSLHQFAEKKIDKNEMLVVKIPKPGGVDNSQLELLSTKLFCMDANTISSSEKDLKRISLENQESIIEKDLSQKMATKNATDPEFLQEFFKKSRLHHIATLGAGFKQYVNELRSKHSGGFPARARLLECIKPAMSVEKSVIMHIDMDCFFVSVGLRSRPHLKGLPVAVTHSMGSEGSHYSRAGSNRELEAELFEKRLHERFDYNSTDIETEKHTETISKLEKNIAVFKDEKSSLSEIASCSYEARKFGIHNGMFVGAALKLCPDLKTISYDFEEYQEVARTLYNTIAQYTLDIEAVSCDEMFVDLSELLISTKLDLMDFITSIRNEIRQKTGCPCSAGLGKNKLQARLATKKAKPDGQYLMENILDHIRDLPITELPGVGYSTSYKLEKLNLKTCSELQKLPLGVLQIEFGRKFGETLYQFCRGIDNRSLQYQHIRQSISVDVNYGIRFTKHSEVEYFLHQLVEELHKRMAEIKHIGKKLTLKILIRAKDAPIETAKYLGTGMCDAVNKTVVLSQMTNNTEILYEQIVKMYHGMNLPPEELRGIGIGMTKLETLQGNHEIKGNPIMEMFKKVQPRKVIQDPVPGTSNEVQITSNKPVIKSPLLSKSIPFTRTPPKKLSNRGRPKKNYTPQKVNRTLTCMFDQVRVKKQEQIDPEFLSALPEDIRKEVIRDHQRLLQKEREQLGSNIICKTVSRSSTDSMKSKSSINFERSDKPVLPVEPKVKQSMNIFLQKNFVIVMSNWINVVDEPLEEDVEVLIKNSTELVRQKNEWDALYLALKFLQRKLTPLSCKWHQAYRRIVDEIQSSMVIYFKNRVLAVEPILCDCSSAKS